MRGTPFSPVADYYACGEIVLGVVLGIFSIAMPLTISHTTTPHTQIGEATVIVLREESLKRKEASLPTRYAM